MLKAELKSYMEVVAVAQKGFNAYLQAVNFPYIATVRPISYANEMTQQSNGVLLVYKLLQRQPASMKTPFQERTYLRPYFVNSRQEPSGLAYTQTYEFRFDNLIGFSFYSTDYMRQQQQQEHFINYMQISAPLFAEKGLQLPIFWEQKPDEVVDIGGTTQFHIQLQYYVQTVQRIEATQDVIRKINIYLETI